MTLIPSDPRCASGVGTRPSPAQARRGSDGSSPRSVWDRPAPRGGDQPPGVSEPPPRPLLSARFTSEGTRPGPAGSAPAPRAPAQTAPAAASSRSAPRRDPPAPPRPAPTWGKPGSGSKVSRAGQGPEAEAQRTSGAQRAAMLERRRRRRGASWVPAAAPVGWGRGPGRAAEGPPAGRPALPPPRDPRPAPTGGYTPCRRPRAAPAWETPLLGPRDSIPRLATRRVPAGPGPPPVVRRLPRRPRADGQGVAAGLPGVGSFLERPPGLRAPASPLPPVPGVRPPGSVLRPELHPGK